MKKILLGISVFCFALASAQMYPDPYPGSVNSGYYGSEEDAYYFPDDYYYDYPEDYYTNDFYESYYDDYRRSIAQVNWNRFFSKYRLSPWQVQQIIMLNESFPSYAAWNSYYRHNPDRWYYDRFYALEQILGPRIFVVYQNNYYRGYSPVVYYQNYRRNHYVTHVYVVPRYRYVNVDRYRINRVQYHQSAPRRDFGFRDLPRNGNGGWQNANANTGFRDNAALPNSSNNGFRSGTAPALENSVRTDKVGNRTREKAASPAPQPQNRGFKNNNESLHRAAPQQNQRSVSPQKAGSDSGKRNNSGFRLTAG